MTPVPGFVLDVGKDPFEPTLSAFARGPVERLPQLPFAAGFKSLGQLEGAVGKGRAGSPSLPRQVYLIVKKRGLTQTPAADLLGLKQPDVSLLMCRGQECRRSP